MLYDARVVDAEAVKALPVTASVCSGGRRPLQISTF